MSPQRSAVKKPCPFGDPVARKLIIDLEPGIGDAVAAILAMLDPEIDLLALTPTSGSVSGGVATRNLHGIVIQIDPPKWPRIGAAEGPDAGPRTTRPELSSLNG